MSFKNSPLLSFVLAHLRTRKIKVLLTFLLVALAKLSALSAPFALKFIVDTTSAKTPDDKVAVIVTALVIAYILALFATTLFDELKSVVAETTVQPLIARVGSRVFSRLINQPHEAVIKRSFGETIKEIDRGLKSLQSLIALSIHTIFPLFVELAILIALIVFYYDFYLAILLIAGIALHLYFTLTSITNLAESREKLNAHDSALSGKFSESINNLETIKIFQSEKFETSRFTSQFHYYTREAVRFQVTYSKVRVVQQAIICGILLILMIRAGWSLSHGDMTSGDFVLLNAMAMQVLIPITFVGTVWKDFTQFAVDIKALSHLLSDTKLTATQKQIPLTDACIELVDVSFTYNRIEPALNKVSLNIPTGSFVAIVGSSGSGKSTILKLMAGLISPHEGKILVNGKALDQKTINSYKQSMAMVPQNVVLFHGSIAENIRYSNRHATYDDMIAASVSAQLHSRITKFPGGYGTPVGERGLLLSGGERQLLGLARALLKNPKILLLDEPSSALDAKTEARWIEFSLLKNTSITRVVVTHRLNSIVSADKIYVVDAGCVIDQGTHAELIGRSGVYSTLWDSQVNINSQK